MATKAKARRRARTRGRARTRSRSATRTRARPKARKTRVRAKARRATPRARAAAGRTKRARVVVRAPARPRPSRRTLGQAMLDTGGTPPPLKFEEGDQRGGRIGDPAPVLKRREEFPRRRVREAGMTAGETTHPDRNTADDAAPDTLLDDEGGTTPADQTGPRSADTALSVVDEAAIGAGGGRDEAEDARVDPIAPAEHARLKRRIARSGGPMANLEPNESRAGSPGRDRNGRQRS